MDTILNLYKERFETPLERITRFVEARPEYKTVPITYAGRLDPMAEGVLPALAGSAVHRKEAVCALSKEYLLEILFGFETDSGDLLGKVKRAPTREQVPLSIALPKLLGALASLEGERAQKVPLYSAVMHEGRYLHTRAREGNIPEILPERIVRFERISLESFQGVTTKQLFEETATACACVQGDFRQEELRETWEEVLRHLPENQEFQTAIVKVTASAGAYMRSLAEEVGEALDTLALARSIVRTRVGDMTIENSVRE